MKMFAKLEEDSMVAKTFNEKLLLRMIKDNKDTVYGKEHGFSNIRSIEEYKENVPFTTYDDYAELVSRMIKGEKNILTAYPIAMYAMTTGSVGVPKMIPVSGDALLKNTGYSFMYEEIGQQKGFSDKKMIVLPMAVETYTESGTPVTNFSGKIILERKKEIVRKLAGPPEIVYGPTSMDYMYLKALYALKDKQVTEIFSSFMSLVSDFFCYIERNWMDLCRDIELGTLDPRKNIPDDIRERLHASMLPDPKRADELRRIFKEGFVAKDLWPELNMVAGIGTGSFSSYLSSVRKFTRDIPLHMIVYAASEGCFGAAMQFDTSDYVLIPDTAFYEFIPENRMYLPDEELMGQTLGLDQLIPGEKYEIVITNISGFYRYRIGDVIQVTGYHHEAPTICFAYRKQQVLNVAGEKTSENHFISAIDSMKEKTGFNVVEWSVYADYQISPARYVVFLELDRIPTKEECGAIRDTLEQGLSDVNSYYREYIGDGHLSPMKVIVLQPQTYLLYREMQVFRGVNVNQLKPVHIIDNPVKEKFFFGLEESICYSCG